MKYSSSYKNNNGDGFWDAIDYWINNLTKPDPDGDSPSFDLADVPGITPAIYNELYENEIYNSLELISMMMDSIESPSEGFSEDDSMEFLKRLMAKGVLDDSGLISWAIMHIINKNYRISLNNYGAPGELLGLIRTNAQYLKQDIIDRRVAVVAATQRRVGRNRNVNRIIDSYLP